LADSVHRLIFLRSLLIVLPRAAGAGKELSVEGEVDRGADKVRQAGRGRPGARGDGLRAVHQRGTARWGAATTGQSAAVGDRPAESGAPRVGWVGRVDVVGNQGP